MREICRGIRRDSEERDPADLRALCPAHRAVAQHDCSARRVRQKLVWPRRRPCCRTQAPGTLRVPQERDRRGRQAAWPRHYTFAFVLSCGDLHIIAAFPEFGRGEVMLALEDLISINDLTTHEVEKIFAMSEAIKARPMEFR